MVKVAKEVIYFLQVHGLHQRQQLIVFLVKLKLEICPEEHDVILFQVWGVLHAKLQDLDLVWVELEQNSEEIAEFFIIANSATPHLQNGLQCILNVQFKERVNFFILQFLDDLLAVLDELEDKQVVIAGLHGFVA